MGQVEWAYGLAKDLLKAELPRRWAHTQGVAEQAETLAPILGADADTLIAACLLHDIGYAPDLVDTGMHQLDGARYLRDVAGADERLCRLVAYHSCADNEARQRDLLDVLAKEFDQERQDLARALTYCDMTTDPDGRHLDVRDRLAEIHSRYGPEHVVSRSIAAATPCIVSSVRAVEAALSDVRQAGAG
ncbi:HD domain-containing protein [Nonomuraea sp. C10]|uniref:HD domain-containing protein n=1 Tax=Nonomuraea sp. C10 TaxID=2600577 RepID=UPI0021C378A2|nr:HD domain-containing protein [Nonomuraea sp. C10]